MNVVAFRISPPAAHSCGGVVSSSDYSHGQAGLAWEPNSNGPMS